MLKCNRPVSCAMLVLGILSSGCRKSTETSAPPSDAAALPAQTAPATKERHHALFTGGVSPLIVSMSPETIPFHDGNVPIGRYTMTYEINGSEKANKAYISVSAPGVGEVQRFDVDLQPRAQIEFFLNASTFDFGPTVRFRVRCPSGDTNWFIMGSDPIYAQTSSTAQIVSIYPGYVLTQGGNAAGMIPLMISGVKFTRECKPEAQVDYSDVELQNVSVYDNRINAVLPFDALQGRPVTARHLEVNLVVSGPSMPAENTYNLNFVE